MSKIALSPNASGTGTFTVAAPNTNTDYTLTLPQGTGTVVANNVNSAIVSGTAVASTSGTSIDFTGIPSWVKRITVMFDGVSTNGTSNFWMRIGDSGGIETTGYLGGVSNISTSVTVATTTNAFVLDFSVAATNVNTGHAILTNISGNTWVCSSLLNNTATGVTKTQAGTKTLSDVLTQLIITTANGTDTFDAGSINILFE
jgi:hypothetical protein